MNGLAWLVPLLACPRCGEGLVLRTSPEDSAQGILVHEAAGCVERYPVIDGVPRLLLGPGRGGLLARHADWFRVPERREIADRWRAQSSGDAVVDNFDYEWSRFHAIDASDTRIWFESYFDVVPANLVNGNGVVLDAGCGAGRWACELANRGPRVIALDLGTSVEVARANAGASEDVACVQADLRALPLRPDTLDWAYSLGVLHHIESLDVPLRSIARAVKNGGGLLIYLYYALDQRGGAYRALFRAVDLVRRVTSRSPRPVMLALAFAFAVLAYWPLARLSRILARLGFGRVGQALPLSSYRERPFSAMWNDSLDRFGTPLEKRFTKEEVRAALQSVGGEGILLSESPPFWHAYARVRR